MNPFSLLLAGGSTLLGLKANSEQSRVEQQNSLLRQQAAMMSAGYALQDADLAEAEAQRERFVGATRAFDQDISARQQMGEATVRQAASGFSVNRGTFTRRMEIMRVLASQDRARTYDAAEVAARGRENEALGLRREAEQMRITGDSEVGNRSALRRARRLNDLGTLIGGATKVNSLVTDSMKTGT